MLIKKFNRNCSKILKEYFFPHCKATESTETRNFILYRFMYQILYIVHFKTRHFDVDEGRTYELEQSTVKCMRGLLIFYMRQSEQVRFSLLFCYNFHL